MAIEYTPNQISVQQLVERHEKKDLNLAPGFQRDSVWNLPDRQKLIESIFRGFPLPAIFLHKREERGEIKFDVIDGKQRIESVLMFMGRKKPAFRAKLHLDEEESEGVARLYTWSQLKRAEKQARLNGYRLQTIEVKGSPSEIIELFVKINSTGKALTPAEKRNARFNSHPFLKSAAKLARKFEPKLRTFGIVSPAQMSRMKHIELICELMVSIHRGQALNKKATLDNVLQDRKSLTALQTQKAVKRTTTALNRVFKTFPRLKTTRFRKASDFYTLSVLFSKFETEGLALSNHRSNLQAEKLLIAFSNGVDAAREAQKQIKGVAPDQELYRSYLSTVTEGTDDIRNRQSREGILRRILEPLFQVKDKQRFFSPEQRRIIWNNLAEPKCKVCGCRLTWDDFTIDHKIAHSLGGLTKLSNADVLCRKHNSRKGNRRTAA